MKLIGSRVEHQMREELIRSNNLLVGTEMQRLVDALRSIGVDASGAYVLDYIPEQAEDIYTVLTPEKSVVTAEVPRNNGAALMTKRPLAEYIADCTKIKKLKVAVALDLLASKSA